MRAQFLFYGWTAALMSERREVIFMQLRRLEPENGKKEKFL